MRLPVLIALVASAMSTVAAGAAERFRPAAPDFVVLRVPSRALNDPIVMLEQRYSQAPSERGAENLASLYLQRAREQRQPRYFGRAERVLQPWVAASAPAASTLRLQADILQNRHDFAGALHLLDAAIARDPRDASARLMRASVRAVQGHAPDTRSDCALVLAAGESAVGTICFAQMLGGSGQLRQADALLGGLLARDRSLEPPVRAWALGLQADFADRRGDPGAAERFLREAMQAAPANEGVRAALADLLIDRGALREALDIVDLPAPSITLLARRARAQRLLAEAALQATRSQIDELLSLAARRGERPHLREEALIALDVDENAEQALRLARANFDMQRETIDARLLTRAARARGDRSALETVLTWMKETGFEDRAIAGDDT